MDDKMAAGIKSKGTIETIAVDPVDSIDRAWSLAIAAVRLTADVVRLLSFRSDLYRSRQALRELPDELLRDVGITRRQAEMEAARPFFYE